MGDRANVAIKDGRGKVVYLYTHWQGTELPEIVRRALSRKQRWNDASYLARIVFCEMVKGKESDETGYGISTSPADDRSYPILILDTDKEQVLFEGVAGAISFADYVAKSGSKWPRRR